MTNLLFQSHFAHCRSNATAEKWPNLNQKQTSKEAVEKQVLLRGSIYQCKLNFLVVQFIHSLGNCISTPYSPTKWLIGRKNVHQKSMPLLALWVCRLSIKLHIGGSVTFFRGLVTLIQFMMNMRSTRLLGKATPAFGLHLVHKVLQNPML